MQPRHLSLLVFITHLSSQLTYWIISEPIQRAAVCVTPVANLQALKRFGFGHGQSRDPGPGDLALFCPACPQPGINLPEGWEYDSNESILLLWPNVMDVS